jgi:hypothetical protein
VTPERAAAEVRDIRVGQQAPVDVATWAPPADDLSVRISRKT